MWDENNKVMRVVGWVMVVTPFLAIAGFAYLIVTRWL